MNVVFDDASVTRSISVIDMSGRTVKQINSITNNNITIDNLMPGIYSLRVYFQKPVNRQCKRS
ncbi:MAG: T9SS type A sorting domain-containing protein [Chitinophagaceae bacterium]|nr:T9SS type A sorting domain-containing protein [Chitinophagaceae bacterium]